MSVDLLYSLLDHGFVMQESTPDIKKRFGKAMRRRRRELDLSQEKLAELAGVHRTYISSIERRERNPSLENIDKIAKALNLSISALFANYGIEVEE